MADMDYFGLLTGAAGIGTSIIAGRKAEKEAEKARKEQEARVAQINSMYDALAKMYSPTGTYGKQMFENLRQQKNIDIGRTAGQYLRSGIGGTTFADVNASYERQVGRGARRTLEDYLQDKYAGVRGQQAAFLSGINTVGPSFSDVASTYSGVGTGLYRIMQALKGDDKKE
jgi:hypothetical protein